MSGSAMIVVEVKRHFQLRVLEWWSAGLMASWGFYSLLLPGMYQENPFMGSLLFYAPQHIWGLIALTAGVIRLIALTVNGFWHRTPAIRWLTSMLSALLWFILTAILFSSPIHSASVIVYAWHIIADIYSAFRSASDYVETAAQRKILEASFAESSSNVRSLRNS